jgi:DNA-binding NarL/FixJ family response regulator
VWLLELSPNEASMRVILADGNPEMREIIRSLLAEHPDIEVIGDAADGRSALGRPREREPALLLMDAVMAGVGGNKATRLVHAALRSIQVIGLSLHDDRHFVEAMRAAVAAGYLREDRAHAGLPVVLRGVDAGGSCSLGPKVPAETLSRERFG